MISESCKAGRHERCRATALTCECEHHREGPTHQPASPGKYRPVVELVWEDPPDAISGNATHQAVNKVLPELRRHPGKWARLLVYVSPSGAGTSATGLRKTFTDIEFTTRRLLEGGSAVYGRFIEGDNDG